MKIRLIFAGFAFVASAVQAERLQMVATNSAGETLYADRDSLRDVPSNSLRQFGTKQLLAVNEVPGGRRTSARQERIHYSFNCQARTTLLLAFRNNRTGIRQQDWRSADLAHKYQPPRPGSLAEMAMMYACSGGQVPVITPPAPIPSMPTMKPNPDDEDGPDGPETSADNPKKL